MAPPPVPSTHVYTSCYCEENIYLLADSLVPSAASADDKDPGWDAYVVFISNHQKTVSYAVAEVMSPRPRPKGAGVLTRPDA